VFLRGESPMPIRKVVGKSVEEALARARSVYGDRAFLLESRRASSSLWERLFSWRKETVGVELLLYIPDGIEGESTSEERSSFSGRPGISITASGEKKAAGAKARENGGSGNQGSTGPIKGKATADPSYGVRQELADLRRLFEQLAQKTPPEYPLDFALWADRLRGRGVSEAVLAALYEAYRGEEGEPQEKLLQAFRMRFASAMWQGRIRDRPTLLTFIGPTGVGKTTTLAKLAGQAVLSGKRIALLTADTYRMAAVEQLGKYAGILGAPMAVARTSEEVARVLDGWAKGRDLVFFDTSGRNYFEEDPGRTMEFLAPARAWGEVHAFLVVAATQSLSDLEVLFDRFHAHAPDAFILTKVDETRSPGNVLDLILRGRFPLAFLACGQSVPFDLARAAPDLLADLLLSSGSIRGSCNRFKGDNVFSFPHEDDSSPSWGFEQGGDSDGRL